jgi:hypothetical protein
MNEPASQAAVQRLVPSLDPRVRKLNGSLGQADIRSDLYSLGVTLWEMLIGGGVPGTAAELMYHRACAITARTTRRCPAAGRCST